ncbi:MAG: GWxTD domain-containing protein [Bacteroidota bacterium]
MIAFQCLRGLMFGQSQAGGRGVFHIDVDYARFYYDDSLAYVEIYYAIPEHIITYGANGGVWNGCVSMKMEIWKDTTQLSAKEWMVPHSIADTTILSKGKVLVGLEKILLPGGDYRLVINSEDSITTQRRENLSLSLPVNLIHSKQETLSDLELSTKIIPSTEKMGKFYKNTLEVIPFPSMLYGSGINALYYYVEMYNLKKSGNEEGLILRKTVVDGMGKEVGRSAKKIKRKFDSAVDYDSIDVTNFNGGTFVLTLNLTDTLAHSYAAVSKKFFIYNPGKIDTTLKEGYAAQGEAASSEYALMNEHDVDSEYTVSRYICSDREHKEYENLKDLNAKRKFMFDFWRRRNTDPTNRINTYRNEYLRRIEFANLHFTRLSRPGWKTDRGRVYVMYGPSSEVEEYSNSSDANPYEIWHYDNIQSGIIFVFVDRNNLGQYILVHSTHRDELHNDNWFAQYAQKTQQ